MTRVGKRAAGYSVNIKLVPRPICLFLRLITSWLRKKFERNQRHRTRSLVFMVYRRHVFVVQFCNTKLIWSKPLFFHRNDVANVSTRKMNKYVSLTDVGRIQSDVSQ
jgi:hypothetical protein